MLDFHVNVVLPYSVFIYSKILPVNIRQEVSIGVLDLKLDSHRATRRSELNLWLLGALFSLQEWRRGSGGNRDLRSQGRSRSRGFSLLRRWTLAIDSSKQDENEQTHHTQIC